MYYQQFEDDSLAEARIETTYHQGILTTHTKKGEWRARWFKVTNKSIQVVNKKARVDETEQAVQLKEVENILYPVTLSGGEEIFDLNNKDNYASTFGIQYNDLLDCKSKKLIAYASSAEECKKWVRYLKDHLSKYRENRLQDVEQFSDLLECSDEVKGENLVVMAKVYINKKMVWEERKVTLAKGALTFHNSKGKLKEKFYLAQVYEFGNPGNVKGSQNPPTYISSVKCLAFRLHSSLRTSSNCTMYIYHADEAKLWRESLKALLH